jgi:hypothetical protein
LYVETKRGRDLTAFLPDEPVAQTNDRLDLRSAAGATAVNCR